ncbi:WGR domain-containing protein, partial [Actinoplanes philippinensis]|uniref:WGR domain-containing protein n=1 Tax=Actinoplanes philippinensis TaxID=35752 RepID=UPI0033D2D063
MRIFEHRSAGSAKFWQVSREGMAVTVRFGRVGATGQERVKELATEEAADMHMAGLIAEKITKGYVEVTSTAGPTAPTRAAPPARAAGPVHEEPLHDGPRQNEPVDLPDEDRFVLPDVWVRRIRPRRGGRPGPRLPSLAGAADKAGDILAETHDHRERVLADR